MHKNLRLIEKQKSYIKLKSFDRQRFKYVMVASLNYNEINYNPERNNILKLFGNK